MVRPREAASLENVVYVVELAGTFIVRTAPDLRLTKSEADTTIEEPILRVKLDKLELLEKQIKQ